MKTDLLSCALLLAAALFPVAGNGAEARQSLIDPATFRGPAADQRAHRVGDLLTVLVLETTRARSQAATGSDRGMEIGIDFSSPSAQYNMDLGTRNKSRGEGETTRIGELRAQITVRVVAVEPNGVMRVSGMQVLTVNKEEQRIVLSGLVRPEDISAANTVWSSRIAEADVSLAGKGSVSAAQRRNLVSRVFQWLGLL
ncbi:MAG: flagellar basal body L-ring protein FlgH [Arenimonas sp.]